ncbi:hypothetical protein WR25_00276 [Diploscapter pachys]|uniref:5'-nucleotidase domain-containing protein 3 n=1 Tax=Diploscapter pachys TaxID=2018661 RepID=A0A2A2J4J8_9BILA|nr:hypothetical protein WR25_00276 [Diploscapter pachys]
MTTIYKIYQTLRSWQHLELPPLVNPRAVFVNNELDLESIAVYGFDYDYTLAVYTRKLNNLIYKLALNRLIEDYKDSRLYNSVTGSLSFERVLTLESGKIYAGGHIEELAKGAGFAGKNVLYFGDHIYTDLAEPMLRLGWRTAAIVPDLAREIRTQNTDNYRTSIQWIEILTALIERFQVESSRSPETHKIMENWKGEREKLRFDMKEMFNAQFGSVFRTYNTMTYFSRRLSDVYTSRVTNFMHYDCNHTFYPRRNALPHENLHSVPVLSSVIALDAVHARNQSDDVNSQKNGVTQNGNYLKINNNANHNDKY